MKVTVEQDSPTSRTLHIEVPSAELDNLKQATLRRLAREVNVPGFRKGKAPMKIIESRVGEDTVREEVLRDALPALYRKALEGQEVAPISSPSINVTRFEDGDLQFSATVEVRPEFDLPVYRGMQVSRPAISVTDEEVDSQIDALRERYGTLEAIGRGAAVGDYVTIDITGYRHDEKIDEATAADLLYEVGSGAFSEKLDEEVAGARPGHILKFNSEMPAGTPHEGEEITFSVIVKDVQTKKLPAPDDEFARTASEFDTLEDLRAEVRGRLESVKRLSAEVEIRGRLIDDLVADAGVTPPETMVAAEVEHQLSRLIAELNRSGTTVEAYLEARGATQEQLVDAYKESAAKSVSADLILEAIAKAESLTATPSEVEEQMQRIAEGAGQPLEKVREDLVNSSGAAVLAGDILRRKALDLVVENAKINETAE